MKQNNLKIVSSKNTTLPTNNFLDFNDRHKKFNNISLQNLQIALNQASYLDAIYLNDMFNQEIFAENRLTIPSNIKELRIENISGYSVDLPIIIELHQSLDHLILKNINNITIIYHGFNPTFKIELFCSKLSNNFNFIVPNTKMNSKIKTLLDDQMLLSSWVTDIFKKTNYTVTSGTELKAGFNRLY